MSDTKDLEELIGRLEKASGPSRELDADISAHIDMLTRRRGCQVTGDKKGYVQIGEDGPRYESVCYTATLDAALTLVPENWNKDIWLKRHNGYHWACTLHIPSYQYDGRHIHAPIAVCIAALRARASLNRDGG